MSNIDRSEWIEDMMNDWIIDGIDINLLGDVFSDSCGEVGVDENDYCWRMKEDGKVEVYNTNR